MTEDLDFVSFGYCKVQMKIYFIKFTRQTIYKIKNYNIDNNVNNDINNNKIDNNNINNNN